MSDNSTYISIEDLPNELLLYIFSYCSPDSINNLIQVCKRWKDLICHSEFLWKGMCISLHECKRLIQVDRELGHSWQKTFQQNYKVNQVKSAWKRGELSKPSCYHALPPKPFCKMDEESWGEIFQMELDRS